MTPIDLFEKVKESVNRNEKVTFIFTFICGLITHLPIMVRDIPNHDGLDNILSYQNMVTSGRWFLSVACSASGFFTIPWIIGLLGLLLLALTAVFLGRILETKTLMAQLLTGALLVSFPALASTFAYVYTLDGYMLGLFLAVFSVYLVKVYKKGLIMGGIALAFSMGIYQSYLPFAIVLSVYVLINGFLKDKSIKEKTKSAAEYLAMGIVGVALYYLLLEVLLFIQGKELDTYQGINSLNNGAGTGFIQKIVAAYKDFAFFTVRGNVLINSIPAIVAFVLLLAVFIWALVIVIKKNKLYKTPWFYLVVVLLALFIPIAFNAVMLVSADVNYHLLMRYQWILCAIIPISFADRYLDNAYAGWAILLAGALLAADYAVTDNVAYSNLQKKYEKTYGYALRLLDRIEQTEGYYPGIPVAIIGVVSDDQYPSTDLSSGITWNIQGMSGDYLLYKPLNYEEFFKYYLGASLNFLPVEEVTPIYYSDEYVAMSSFPGADSTKVVNGILYVKTENEDRSNE